MGLQTTSERPTAGGTRIEGDRSSRFERWQRVPRLIIHAVEEWSSLMDNGC